MWTMLLAAAACSLVLAATAGAQTVANGTCESGNWGNGSAGRLTSWTFSLLKGPTTGNMSYGRTNYVTAQGGSYECGMRSNDKDTKIQLQQTVTGLTSSGNYYVKLYGYRRVNNTYVEIAGYPTSDGSGYIQTSGESTLGGVTGSWVQISTPSVQADSSGSLTIRAYLRTVTSQTQACVFFDTVTIEPACTPPDPPTGGSATADSTSQITWGWTQPSGTGITYKGYDAASGGNLKWTSGADVATYAEGSLDANTQYTRWVASFKVCESSRLALPAKYTLANTPDAPSVTDPQNQSLKVDPAAITPSSTELAITIGGGSYTLGTDWVQSDGTVGTSKVWQTDANWGTKTVTGLTNGTEYTFKVRARNGDGVETADGAGATGTPENVCYGAVATTPTGTLTVCEGETTELTETPSSGTEPFEYQWQICTTACEEEGNWANCVEDTDGDNVTSATMTTMSTAANGTQYRCVVTNCDDTETDTSAAVTLTVNDVVDDPTAGTPTVNGTDSITWNWNDASTENGYHIYDAASGGTLVATLGADETSYEETGLAPGTEVSRWIAAYNTNCGDGTRVALGTESTDSRACIETYGFEDTFTDGVANHWSLMTGTTTSDVREDTTTVHAGTEAQGLLAPSSGGDVKGVWQQLNVASGSWYNVVGYGYGDSGNVGFHLGVNRSGLTTGADLAKTWTANAGWESRTIDPNAFQAYSDKITIYAGVFRYTSTGGWGRMDDIAVSPGITDLYPRAPGSTLSPAPEVVTVCAGSTATLSIEVAGDDTGVTYQWYEKLESEGVGNFAPIDGATSATYTTPQLAYLEGDSYNYRVAVTGPSGTACGATVTSYKARVDVLADVDSDGLCEPEDTCPNDPDNDIDSDGICGDVDNCPNDANPGQEDADSDGYGAACDCIDTDDTTYPGATELCDGVDNDCDSSTDEGAEAACDDSNVCTDDSCTAGACVHSNNTASCDDGDACTTGDVCADGVCAGTEMDCDDDDVCTDDSCVDGACVHTNNTASCDDGDSCTTGDVCADGVCAGTPMDCDDSNVCTDDSCVDGACVHTPNTAACDDEDACTENDVCSGGTCAGTAISCDDSNGCTDDSCDPETGCVHTNNTASCDDGDACTENDVCSGGTCAGTPMNCDDSNVCTDDSCVDGACVHTDNSAPCNDGDPCTVDDVCSGGACAGTPMNCSDGNVCTDDSCVDGACVHTNNTASCDDNSACTENDVCSGGTCAGTAISCDDSNPCTDDGCDPQTGCTHTNNDANACTDGDACTEGDHCSAGSCVPGTPKDCDDDNMCTADSCVDGSCVHTPTNENEACDDGNACTEDDVCTNGVCAGTGLDCNDDNPCTDDSCVDGACVHTNNTASCDDGDACTEFDVCSGGTCAGTPINCNDGNVCTDDSCVDGACVHTNNTASCDDGNACTTGDVCSGGTCAGTPMNCDDSNVCTDDSCVDGACVHTNNTESCNDGDPCTTGDVCSGGTCAGTPIDCDDSNVCTDDSCVDGVCVHTNNAASCDDGDACTTGDVCSGGACAGTPMDCDDSNVCTDDSCVDGACVHTNNSASCDDGDACTTGDVCSGGACAGTPMDCDDSNVCTDDSCVDGACVHTNNSASCDDGDACTTGDVCSGGACAGTPMDCDDSNVCTDDSCVDGACVHTNNSASCDDGDACTTGDVCSGGACAGTPMDCDDDNECTDDECVDGACVHTNNTASCDDEDACTENDVCSGGTCAGTAVDCDDDNECTEDSCDPETGCVHTPVTDGTSCDDGDPCTAGDTCQSGVCTGGAPPEEVCDGVDNDCDSLTDEEGATGCSTYYKDVDDDTYGLTGDSKCLCGPDGDYTASQGGDCNDGDAAINPGAEEACGDSVDNDCDGSTDEGCLAVASWWSVMQHALTPTNNEAERAARLDELANALIESRRNQDGTLTLRAVFNGPVSVSGDPAAAVSVKDSTDATVPVTGASVAGNAITITVAYGVANGKKLTATLDETKITGMSASDAKKSILVKYLVGDVSADGDVNTSDFISIRGRINATLTSENFKYDVNLSGSINLIDIAMIRNQMASGATSVPD